MSTQPPCLLGNRSWTSSRCAFFAGVLMVWAPSQKVTWNHGNNYRAAKSRKYNKEISFSMDYHGLSELWSLLSKKTLQYRPCAAVLLKEYDIPCIKWHHLVQSPCTRECRISLEGMRNKMRGRLNIIKGCIAFVQMWHFATRILLNTLFSGQLYMLKKVSLSLKNAMPEKWEEGWAPLYNKCISFFHTYSFFARIVFFKEPFCLQSRL